MRKPKILVLTGYGINCDYETQGAFNHPAVGGDAGRVHINDIIDDRESLDDYQILAFPGGFSFGDDIGAGKVLASRFEFRLGDKLQKFISDGKLVIGICNGFQAITKLQILPGLDGNGTQQATLTFNDSGRFEDRWVYLKANRQSPCVFTRGMDTLYLPVRHGEGKFVPADEAIASSIVSNNQIALSYSTSDGESTREYPLNPNGSWMAAAGVCDPTGRIFGLMPHPEAYTYGTNHPRWTREQVPEEGMGLVIFRNAVRFAVDNLL
jgi:phosphoribosylformylglycinamidine synthase